MDLPDELTVAEDQLRRIYTELRTLKDEAAKKKEAADAAASKKRGNDMVAEAADVVVKKLRNAGILEKLHATIEPKTQYKRSSTLQRRLYVEKSELSTEIPTQPSHMATKPSFTPKTPLAPSDFLSKPPSSSYQSRSPQKRSSSPSDFVRPKSLYDSFITGSKNVDEESDTGTPSSRGDDSEYPKSEESACRHRGLGFQNNGSKQKMILVEASRIDEPFLRPLFDRFGPIVRITPVPNEKRALILYKLHEDSQEAIREMDGETVDGVTLHVSAATRRQDSGDSGARKSLPEPLAPSSLLKPGMRELITYEEGEVI